MRQSTEYRQNPVSLRMTILLLFLFRVASVASVTPSAPRRQRSNNEDAVSTMPKISMNHLRSTQQQQQQRELPGNEVMDATNWSATQTGAVSGLLFLLFIICVLYCCCGCSICDLLALWCCYEICCEGSVFELWCLVLGCWLRPRMIAGKAGRARWKDLNGVSNHCIHHKGLCARILLNLTLGTCNFTCGKGKKPWHKPCLSRRRNPWEPKDPQELAKNVELEVSLYKLN